MKLLRVSLGFFPFLITLVVLFFLRTNEITTIQKAPEKIVKTQDALPAGAEEYKTWQKNILPKLEKLNKDQIIVKKNSRVYGPDNLNENKKLLIKIMFLGKCKKEYENFQQKFNFNDEASVDLKNKIDNMLTAAKEKLYNINRDSSLLDKKFLENLDVYIQH